MNSIQIAGRSVRRSAQQQFETALWSAVGAVALLAVGVLLGARELGALLIAIGILLGVRAARARRAGVRFRVGAIAEERIASRFWKLEALDWLVEHDVEKVGGGNVDHVVHSPAATFVIETKAGGGAPEGLAQAQRHAHWAAARYKHRKVVPVLCMSRSDHPPELVDGVYRVGARHLVDLLLDMG